MLNKRYDSAEETSTEERPGKIKVKEIRRQVKSLAVTNILNVSFGPEEDVIGYEEELKEQNIELQRRDGRESYFLEKVSALYIVDEREMQI
ncbi:hypothetical protein TNCV_5102951 [Trichonephila clavipes]|nr:hypothetical protein TNCV_5102951 [Trichonephila clavipes]